MSMKLSNAIKIFIDSFETIEAAAVTIGVHPNTVRNWRRGKSISPLAARQIQTAMTHKDLRQSVGMKS